MKSIKSITGKVRFISLDLLIIFFLIFFIHLGAFLLIKDHGMMMDEHYHFRQIVRFMNGDFKPDPELPMIPGYHYVVSGIGKLFGVDKIYFYDAVAYVRFISFTFGLLAIIVFYMLASMVDKKGAIIKTLQFSFFPLIFPLFPLMYTDLLSLLIILLSMLFAYKKHYTLSAIVIALSIYVRQNNLVWLVFVNILIYLMNYGFKISYDKIKSHIKKTYAFLLGPILFGLYILVNGRVAMGGETHVFFTVSWSNLFIINFYFVMLFAPIIICLFPKMLRFLYKNWKYLIIILPIAFPIYAKLFQNSHPFNLGTFFIHNLLAVFFTASLQNKLILYIVMVISITALIKTELLDKRYYILYPFSFLFLLPLWFIEERYYIVPFILLLLYRKRLNLKVEYIFIIFSVIVSFYFYSGEFRWVFFP